MSFWNTLKSHAKAQFLDVIQWMEDDRETVVYRYPVFNQAIQDGGKLVVRPGQSAVFVNEGQASEAFGPGTYEINSRTKALVSFFESIKYQLNYPYKGDIFYVSTREFSGNKWGTPQPLSVMDDNFGSVEIRAHGVYTFKITDPVRFLETMVGNFGLFETDEVQKRVRDDLLMGFMEAFGQLGDIDVHKLHSSAASVAEALSAAADGLVERERIVELVAGIAEVAGRDFDPETFPELVDRITERGIDGLSRELEPVVVDVLQRDSLVVHCWRGGLRSASVAAFLQALGWNEVHMLYGGYKSYRAEVMRELDQWQAPPAFVLRGLTGTGKTLVLRELERLRPGWTLDLELAAGHRSSILGMVGLEPVSQKHFETRLAARIRQGFPGLVVYEGESRKVGDVVIPRGVWAPLDTGVNLEITAPIPRRVDVLCEDYLEREENREHLERQLPYIERRLGSNKYDGVLVGLLRDRRERELVETLLELYYDPLYRHSKSDRDYAASFDSSDVSACAAAIAEWIESRPDAD